MHTCSRTHVHAQSLLARASDRSKLPRPTSAQGDNAEAPSASTRATSCKTYRWPAHAIKHDRLLQNAGVPCAMATTPCKHTVAGRIQTPLTSNRVQSTCAGHVHTLLPHHRSGAMHSTNTLRAAVLRAATREMVCIYLTSGVCLHMRGHRSERIPREACTPTCEDNDRRAIKRHRLRGATVGHLACGLQAGTEPRVTTRDNPLDAPWHDGPTSHLDAALAPKRL